MEKQFQEVFPDLRIEGGMAELLDTVEVSRVSRTVAHHINLGVLESDCCRASFLRGAFLAGGSVTDPNKTRYFAWSRKRKSCDTDRNIQKSC